MSFMQRFRKYARWCIILFLVLFLFRLAYGYWNTSGTEGATGYVSDFFNRVDNLRKNYATENNFSGKNVGQQAAIAAQQKYEKTATVKSKSTQFEQDLAKVNQRIELFNAVIQYEQNTGNAGSREIHMLLGIAPEKFDSFYVQMQQVGQVRVRVVTKVDKTNEYRQLNAKKASLEKTLASLNDLKSRGGAISDFVSLHDKILEIENQLQELGVELGNFDTENQFCTVRFSMYEGAAEKKIGLLHRVKVALEWTIRFYAMFMVGVLGAACVVFLLLLIIDKLQGITAAKNK